MEWANDRVLDPKVLNKGNKKTGGHSPYNRSTQCLCPKASRKSESLAVAILVWNTWNSLSTVHFSSPSLSTDSCPSSTDRGKKKKHYTLSAIFHWSLPFLSISVLSSNTGYSNQKHQKREMLLSHLQSSHPWILPPRIPTLKQTSSSSPERSLLLLHPHSL